MDIYATIITGIKWGLIIDACWIIPYFALLFYHFYAMESNPAYAMRYERSERMIKRLGKKEAIIENSNLRVVSMRIKRLWSMIKRIPSIILEKAKRRT